MISIIVPIYNVEAYLETCVKSILEQTYSDLEIILVNDGSTDSCKLICDAFVEKDRRIRVIHKKNGGLSSARNAGLDIACGEYVSFVDSDDYIAADLMEQLLLIMEKSKADVACSNITKKERNISKSISYTYKVFSPESALQAMFRNREITTSACGKLFKMKLFKKPLLYFPEGKIYEDYAVMYKVFHRANHIAYVDISKYFYRYNAASITRTAFSLKRMDYFDISEELLLFIKENYPNLVKYANNRDASVAISFYRQISITNFDDERIIAFLRKYIKERIGKYIFSCYKLTSKAYGVLIVFFPQIALLLFRK